MAEINVPIQVNLPDDWIEQIVNRLRNDPQAEWVEIVRCKDCRFFEYDHPYIVQGVPVLGHLVCDKWGDGCRTAEDGFCFMAERRTDEPD